MNGAERILDIIGKVSIDNNSPRIRVGTYIDGGIKGQDITITSDMVYKPDYLVEKRAKKVSGTISESGGETHSHTFTDTSEYINPIQNNDLVAYYQLNDEKFLILCKVV